MPLFSAGFKNKKYKENLLLLRSFQIVVGKVFLNDLFYILDVTKVCNYADDTTLHACDDSLKQLISRLEHDCYLAINWFENNYMKLNTDKCHLMISGH